MARAIPGAKMLARLQVWSAMDILHGWRKPFMRLRQVLLAKIHRATVTEADVNYVGSITIDQDLMDKVGMLPGELVHVWNGTNGERLETYTIAGERGSRIIQMNGPAALRCRVGDKIVIASFLLTDEPEAIQPKVALVDDENRFTGYANAFAGGII